MPEDRDTEASQLPEEITAWAAVCPNCDAVHLTMLTKEGGGHGRPWKEIIGGVTEVEEADFYCETCRSFVDLKDPNTWQEADA